MTDYFAQLAAQRRSVRAFLPTPVPQATLEQLLRAARLAPSGGNLQPGTFIAVRGAVRQSLSEALTSAWRAGTQEQPDYGDYPRPLPPLLHRRQIGAAQALYGALGLERRDRAGRASQFERNYRFYDAPVAMVLTLDPACGGAAYLDLGMALYGLMLAAQAQGLATCAIGALAAHPTLVRRILQLEAKVQIVCGLAMGYADARAPINQTRTERAAPAEFFRTLG